MKKIWFMLQKFLTDMRRLREKGYALADDIKSDQLGYYYFKFDEKRVANGKDQKLISRFDENGIPVNKTYIDVVDKDYVYFPISIGQMGLAVFHTYLETNSVLDKERFLKFVDWFYDNAIESEQYGTRWLTDVDLPAYKRKAPWQSAFAQSRGISILLRGYQLTNNRKYKDMAERALVPFIRDVHDGGVVMKTEFGPFYEEYTSEVGTLVLNGKIFALWGVYDFLRVTPEHHLAQTIFNDGVQTLAKILPQYDLGFWSKYNLCNAPWYPAVDPATIGYQKLHVLQLESMYRLTNNKIFKTYHDIFKNQINAVNIFKMYLVKFKALRSLKRL